jgi:hypothetical protein
LLHNGHIRLRLPLTTDKAQLVLEALLQLADVATHHIDDGVSALTDMVEGLNDDFFDDFDDHIEWHSKDYEHYEDADAIDASLDINHHK